MSLATTLDLDSTLAPPTGCDVNAVQTDDGGSPVVKVAFGVPRMVGDTGSGGKGGGVPPPAAGDAAAGKFLKADGTWSVVPSGSSINEQTGTTYTFLATDVGKLVLLTNAASIAATLPSAATAGFGVGFYFAVKAGGAGTVTITPTTSLINGAASLELTTGAWAWVWSDGTNYFALVSSAGATVTVTRKVGLSLQSGTLIATGPTPSVQVDYAGTIVGWSIEADSSTASISISVAKAAGTQTAPVVPDPVADVISGSAPITLSSQQANGVGSAGLTGWTTSVAPWDSFIFNVLSASNVKFATLWIAILETL